MALWLLWQDIINSLGRNRKALLCSHTILSMTEFLLRRWVSIQGKLGTPSSVASRPLSPPPATALDLMKGSATFLSPRFLCPFSTHTTERLLYEKNSGFQGLSQPSFHSDTAGAALLGGWLEAGSSNWESWFQFPGPPWVFCGTQKGLRQTFCLVSHYKTSDSAAHCSCLSYLPGRNMKGRRARFSHEKTSHFKVLEASIRAHIEKLISMIIGLSLRLYTRFIGRKLWFLEVLFSP